MPKALLIMIGPHRNAHAKGIMADRASMMDGMDGMDGDGMDGDDGQDGQDGHDGSVCAYVPVEALSVEGEPPGVGDTVNFSVEGTIRNIKDGTAEVDIKTVDGQDVDGMGGESPEGGPNASESLADMGARLRKKANESSGIY